MSTNRVASRRVRLLEPPGRWSPLRLNDLWHYRELLYILAWRDVKVRYKQAVLGAAWAVLQPLIFMGVFTLLFSRVAKVPTPPGVPYPVFAIVGLVPWTLFSNGVVGSSASLVANQDLVSKVWFPRMVIPVSAVLAHIPDFGVGAILLVIVMALERFAPPLTILLLPLVLIAAAVAAISVGVWMAALNVAYRDVQYVVPFLMQVWLFITPVAYPTTAIPQGMRWLAGLNPMSWVVELSRWSMVGSSMPMGVSLASILTMVALLVSGLYYFRKVEHYFADVI